MGFRAESGSDSRSIGLAIECAPTFGVSVGHSAAILDAREG